MDAQESRYNLPKACRKRHPSFVLRAVGKSREGLLTPHLYLAVLILLSVDADGRPASLYYSTKTHWMGILGFQSYAPSMLGNLVPTPHFLCTLKHSLPKVRQGSPL